MNTDIIQFSMNQKDKIVGLLNKMLILKKKNNKEIEVTLSDRGITLTTELFHTLAEGLVIYSNLIFQELEISRENIFSRPETADIIEQFSNRENMSNTDHMQKSLTPESIEKLHINFKKELDKVIDFSNPKAVYSWLNELKKYVNNPQLSLLLDDNGINSVSYLIRKLEVNGYSETVTNVDNLDDYYRKLISYQLQELKEYGFFAYEYMIRYLEKKDAQIVSQNSVELNTQLNELLSTQQNLQKRLTVFKLEKEGKIKVVDKKLQKTVGFSERKQLLEKEMEAIQNKTIDDHNMVTFEKSRKAAARLQSVIQNTNLEKDPAILMYNKASTSHNLKDIVQAIDAAKQLDNGQTHKESLLKALSSLVEVYYPNEIAEGIDKIERFNGFFVNESVKNNPTLPLFNKAVETYNVDDIKQAIEATEQLDDSYMYKKPMLNTLVAMRNNIEKIHMQEEMYRMIQSVNNYLAQNPMIESSPFISLYRKATESKSAKDIMLAIQALKAPENANNQVTANMKSLLDKMLIDYYPELVNLRSRYQQLLQEEQKTVALTTAAIEKTEQELTRINVQITDIQQKIESSRENQTSNERSDNSPVVETPNLPGSSSPYAMLPKEPLEEDYYQRLENAAKEGPIFHDDDIDFDLTPKQEKPHIIKEIKKAPSKLLNKIKNSSFVKLTSKVLNMMKKHQLATTVATLTMLGVAGIAKTLAPEAENVEPINTVVIEDSVQNLRETVANNTSQNVENQSTEVTTTETEIETKSDEEKFNDELNEALTNILGGNMKIYTSVDRAIDSVEAKQPSEKQLNNYWSNATPAVFYESEAGKTQTLTREEAEKVIAEGGEVVARFDNNGTPIGYAKVGQEMSQDNSTKSM